MFQTKVVEKIEKLILCPTTLFENHAFLRKYEKKCRAG
jgi:hypothetical protein